VFWTLRVAPEHESAQIFTTGTCRWESYRTDWQGSERPKFTTENSFKIRIRPPGFTFWDRRPSDLAQKTQFFQIFCGREKLNQSVETYKLSLLCSVLHLHWDHLVTNKFWTMKNNKFICNQILFQVLHKCFGLRMLFTFVPLGFCGRNWKRNKKVPRDCSFHYPKYPKSENQGRSSAHGWPALVSK